ncbi:MAG: hypothetical protein VB934_04405 [Polyangiaceae bacterium]
MSTFAWIVATAFSAASATPAESKDDVAATPAPPEAAVGEPSPTDVALVKGAAIDKANWRQKNAARKAYRAGMKAFDAKKYDEAMAAFVKSYGVVASPNSHLMVVRTMLAKEQYLAAYGQAQLVTIEAKEAAAKEARYQTTVQGAEQLVSDIAAKLSSVKISTTVPVADKSAVLQVNGRALERGQWGQPLTVMPGPIKIALTTAAGKTQKTVTAVAGQQHAFAIEPPAPKPVATASVAEESGGSFFDIKWPGPDRKKIAYISGGVGAVGMLTFGIFGALSVGQAGRLEDGCPDPAHCDPQLESFADRGQAYQTVANTGLVLGIIGLSTGAGFYVWDHFDEGADSVQSPYRPRVAVGPGTFVVSGSF